MSAMRAPLTLAPICFYVVAAGCTSQDGNGGVGGVPGIDGGGSDLRGLEMFDLSSGPDHDLIDKLLKLTALCTSTKMVSQHTYPDPGSAVNDVPICALMGAVFFNADMAIDCDGRPTAGIVPRSRPDLSARHRIPQPQRSTVGSGRHPIRGHPE
jgi:hypothetical protein